MQDDGNGIKALMRAKGIKALWWALIWGTVLFQTGPAFAHKVYIFAWVEGDRVYTDSYFPDKRKVIGGAVEVFDPAGRKLVEGKTDEQGAFSFKVPQRSDLKIILNATMGHRAEFTLKAEEIPEDIAKTVKEPEGHETVTGTRVEMNADLKDLESVIKKNLEEKLKPIERKLAQLQEDRGPGFTEVIGGIGYIFGLMGIVLYFKNRRSGERNTKAQE